MASVIRVESITNDEYESISNEGYAIFLRLAERQNELAMSQDTAAKYMSTLKELIDTKQITPIDKNLPVHLAKQGTLCYCDAEIFYFIPQSTYNRVCEFMLRKGELLNVSDYMLRKMLADKGYITKSTDGDSHLTSKIKIGLSQVRVITISRRVLNLF